MPRPPCGRPTTHSTGEPCWFPREPGKRSCKWHLLLKASPSDQQDAADARREEQLGHDYAEFQARVPKDRWPHGCRWCAGCQSFVPFFYCSGSRCRACASTATHAAHVERTYGLSESDYHDLLIMQGGRCYICRRAPKTKRLAVDHDHDTGRVRGLLCPDNERGCNMAVLGGLSTAADGALAAAKRAVEYLEDPPYERLKRAQAGPRPDWMS